MGELKIMEEELSRAEIFALKMPTWDDFVVRTYRKDPSLAAEVLESEIEEYKETSDIRYVLKTAKHIAEARGIVV